MTPRRLLPVGRALLAAACQLQLQCGVHAGRAVLENMAPADDSDVVRKPPLGWSSWNYLGTGPTAPLLLDTADAFSSTGLRDAGYRYIIATEGWNLANRTAASGALQPAPSFTNSSVRALSDQLHAKVSPERARARRACLLAWGVGLQWRRVKGGCAGP